MMRKIFVVYFLLGTLGAFAQTTMHEIIKLMPDTIVPYLTENNRLDFIDFIDSGMKAEVSNTLGGKSEMLKLTDWYTLITLNEASTLQLRLFDTTIPVDSVNQIVCLVQTYGTNIRESKIAFYSAKWHRLTTSDYVTLPDDGMWIATLDEKEPILTLTSEYHLDAPANEEQQTLPKTSIILKWDGNFLK